MENEIKTEDIIKSLRVCARFDSCEKCIFANEDARCSRSLMEEAADRLEQLSNQHIKIQYCNEELTIGEMCIRMDRLRGKLNAARLENELLKNHIGGKCVIAQYAEGGTCRRPTEPFCGHQRSGAGRHCQSRHRQTTSDAGACVPNPGCNSCPRVRRGEIS